MTTPAAPSYAGYRFPAEIISHAVWLYFRFPLSLRMVDELLAVRRIVVSHETVRQWAELTEGSAGAASGMVNGGAEVRRGPSRQVWRVLSSCWTPYALPVRTQPARSRRVGFLRSSPSTTAR